MGHIEATSLKSHLMKNNRLIVHILIWAFVATGYGMIGWKVWAAYSSAGKFFFWFGFLLFPAVFYVNTYRIIPFFRQRKMAFLYGTVLFLGLFVLEFNKTAIFEALKALLDTDFNFNRFTTNYTNGPIGLGVMASLGYSFIKYVTEYPKLVDRLKSEKAAMELAFLQSQVDPHFLFNTLNSIYGLALAEKGQKTADSIAKLGTLMRYNLHDSKAEFISLNKEIDYIENYIELQRLRATKLNKINVDIQLNGTDAQEKKIAPMLLIPFVENAFKFGINPRESSIIMINILLDKNNFVLTAENSIVGKVKKDDAGGIGLKNVKDRLALLYPNRHKLTCEQRENMYHVKLSVTLTSPGRGDGQ